MSLNLEKTTTETLLKEAEAHLCKVDTTGKLQAAVKQHHCKVFSPQGLQEEINPFAALASSIISQQVSYIITNSGRRRCG